MTDTLYVIPNDLRCAQVLKMAAVAGCSFSIIEVEDGGKVNNLYPCPFNGLYPLLDSNDGVLWGCRALLHYSTNHGMGRLWFGQNGLEHLKIHAFLDICTSLETLYYELISNNIVSLDILEDRLRSLLQRLDEHLLKNTYLVGESASIADLCITVTMKYLMGLGTVKIILAKEHPNLLRWYSTISKQLDALVKMCKGEAESTSIAKKPSQSAKEKQSKATIRAADASESEDDEKQDDEAEDAKYEDEEALAVKELNALPPSSFNLDAWKREYSNSADVANTSMKWFWDNYDSNGWSVYTAVYQKLINECKIQFQTTNMLAGFIQRIHNGLRRHSFGVFVILEKNSAFDIQGLVMFRGATIPRAMKMHPSFEFYTFTQLDINNQSNKKLICDYFCAGRSQCSIIGGLPIVETNVFK